MRASTEIPDSHTAGQEAKIVLIVSTARMHIF